MPAWLRQWLFELCLRMGIRWINLALQLKPYTDIQMGHEEGQKVRRYKGDDGAWVDF